MKMKLIVFLSALAQATAFGVGVAAPARHAAVRAARAPAPTADLFDSISAFR